ncbi:MAG TPA: thiamine-phosphate kinase [Gemmatimonadaceae bacterium]|nr:thiamine-phosphate kinase [Gemmatimonadaceae bacterium]
MSSAHTAIGQGVEFDAIRRMLERWGANARGVGDDAAVIPSIGDRSLVVSIDTSVENVHFRREWLTPREIGYRATAAALSDIAAMGARPLGILVAMTIPDGWRNELDGLTDGIGEASAKSAAPVIGGDTTRGHKLSLTITVLGTVRDALTRAGAQPGNSVYVTGRLGGPRAALRDLEAGRAPSEVNRERFAHPVPRILESAWLAANGATAAIDISDGLSAEVDHLASASKLSIIVRLEDVPAVEGVSPTDAVLSGEEYELLITGPASLDTAQFKERFGLDLTLIGEVTEGPIGAMITQNGKPVTLPAGYLHFTE